jgi:cellulose synthase/poly-beta-1,6-N-acetylglucosamine synthase-like glycosyltransferase
VNWVFLWNKQEPREAVQDKNRAGVWPRIAPVIPVYHSEKYVEQTIVSVLAQNYPNLDYFIVDRGSTDGAVKIIRKYESQISLDLRAGQPDV